MNYQFDFAAALAGDNAAWLWRGIQNMLELTAYAWLLAMAVGTMLAVVRMTEQRWAVALVAAYVEYHRNVPILVQIFIWYFGIPTALPQGAQQWLNANNSEFVLAFVAIGLCMAAYFCEDLRSGIRSIPRSQYESARALGMGYINTVRRVILPQAIAIAMPTLVNHTVLLFKNSSLAMVIGVAELTYVTREIENQTFRTLELYLVCTLIYLAISLVIMAVGELLEQRTRIKAR